MTTLDRRAFLRAAGLSAAGLAGAAAPALAQQTGKRPLTSKRPNIVLILADDMGFSDLGCYGSEIRTPNIDGLAARGVRFTQFYNCARCCPTRASLLTGLYPHQAGIGHMTNNYHEPGYQGFLNDRCVTIAEVLREAGYRTLMSGKWHVGEQRPHWPTDRGFDHYWGLISGASSYFTLDSGRGFARDDRPATPDEEGHYLTDGIGRAACDFIDQNAGRGDPFFLYVAFTSPHWPLHALPEDIERYRGTYTCGWDELRRRRRERQIELGIIDRRWPLTPRDPQAPAWEDAADKEELDLRMAVYAAQIDRMDQNVGRILERLRANGVEDNTLVMFLADNGGCAEKIERGKAGAVTGTPDSYCSYGLPWANASNTPFRLYKHWVHEGGIATPFIARWPAAIPQDGRIIRSQFAHVIDVMATCVDVSAALYPQEREGTPIFPMEGASLFRVLRGQQRQRPVHDQLCWEHEGNRAIRRGKWKLVSRFPDRWELYDLEADRTEMTDLAAQHPDKVQELLAAYEAWAEHCNVIPWDKLKRGQRTAG